MKQMQNPTSKKQILKRLMLACGILASLVNTGLSALNEQELEWALNECYYKSNKNACQALIDDDAPSVEECDEYEFCKFVGIVYRNAGHYRESIPYFEKMIALGDNNGYGLLGDTYYFDLKDYFNAKKYYEIGCNKGNKRSCYNAGNMYKNGEGVRQNYHKAHELYKKACDMKDAQACNNLGVLYGKGLGVKQNLSIAKQYYDKACDLGNQLGCDNYKRLDSAGVQ